MTEQYILTHPFIFAGIMFVVITALFAAAIAFGRLLAEVQIRFGIPATYTLAAMGMFSLLLGFGHFIAAVTT